VNREELAKFMVAIQQVREANTASPEAARSFLECEGYLNKDGTVTDHYKSAESTDSH
jgi:hypothetical protein